MVAGRYELESSGGITFATLRDYAECGVDYISVGALTHSVKGAGYELQGLLKNFSWGGERPRPYEIRVTTSPRNWYC